MLARRDSRLKKYFWFLDDMPKSDKNHLLFFTFLIIVSIQNILKLGGKKNCLQVHLLHWPKYKIENEQKKFKKKICNLYFGEMRSFQVGRLYNKN